MSARCIERVAPRLVDLAEYRDLIAERLREQDTHLRVDDEAAVPKGLRDLVLGRRGREVIELHRSDQRIADGAGFRDAHLERQVGALEDADLEDVAGPDVIFLKLC